VSFEREETILPAISTDRMPLLKRIVARLIGFDAAYHRFTGKVTIEKFEEEVRVERFDNRAIWELMYFGKARRWSRSRGEGEVLTVPKPRGLVFSRCTSR
jgi:glutamyl/glutaminyl-tRNA synthetase